MTKNYFRNNIIFQFMPKCKESFKKVEVDIGPSEQDMLFT